MFSQWCKSTRNDHSHKFNCSKQSGKRSGRRDPTGQWISKLWDDQKHYYFGQYLHKYKSARRVWHDNLERLQSGGKSNGQLRMAGNGPSECRPLIGTAGRQWRQYTHARPCSLQSRDRYRRYCFGCKSSNNDAAHRGPEGFSARCGPVGGHWCLRIRR